MASRSFAMAVRETKDRLKGILVGPDSTLDLNAVEAEFDARIAEEQRLMVEEAAKESVLSFQSTSVLSFQSL